MPWIVWLIAAVALGVAEYFTLTWLRVARCRSARRRDRRRFGRPAGTIPRLRDRGWGGAADRAADRETADDPSFTGARGQLRAGRQEGGGSRGGHGTQDSSSSPVRCGRRVRSMRTT